MITIKKNRKNIVLFQPVNVIQQRHRLLSTTPVCQRLKVWSHLYISKRFSEDIKALFKSILSVAYR